MPIAINGVGASKLISEEVTLFRCPKNPLRPLLEEDRRQLIHLSRGQAAAASQVARAKAVLAVVPRHGGGRLPDYTALERERILVEARQLPS